MGKTLNRYRVVWEIDIDAEGPVAAAKEAQKIQRHLNSFANVFEVFEDGMGGHPVRVDLDDLIVKSVQVIPICEQGDEVTPQFSGPNEFTTGWAVYARLVDGTVEWQTDAINEDIAMLRGAALASKHAVAIEPQPWKTK